MRRRRCLQVSKGNAVQDKPVEDSISMKLESQALIEKVCSTFNGGN